MPETQDKLLFRKLNQETAVIAWHELQRFFAQGKVLIVDQDDDLVSIAKSMAADQSSHIELCPKIWTGRLGVISV